ncbi:hypothetical protein GBF38_022379, partial [Nibea albiflora]
KVENDLSLDEAVDEVMVELVGEVDGRGYLSVGQRGVHAGYVQVAAVVRPLATVGWHEGRHPAAVGVAQGLALLRAVGEQVSTCRQGLTGSETGNKDCALAGEPEETCSQTGDGEGQTDGGGVTDFTDRDSRQEKQQDCRNHKEGEGETWAVADGKSNGQKKRQGETLQMELEDGLRREEEGFDLSTRSEQIFN